jgi:hypothetical protein
MEMADKWNRHEIAVNEDMVAFVEESSNLKQFFHSDAPQAIFEDVVLVFLRPDPSVHEKPQAVIGYRVTQHPKFDSPMVVVLVRQTLHEAFVDTNFLIRVS